MDVNRVMMENILYEALQSLEQRMNDRVRQGYMVLLNDVNDSIRKVLKEINDLKRRLGISVEGNVSQFDVHHQFTEPFHEANTNQAAQNEIVNKYGLGLKDLANQLQGRENNNEYYDEDEDEEMNNNSKKFNSFVQNSFNEFDAIGNAINDTAIPEIPDFNFTQKNGVYTEQSWSAFDHRPGHARTPVMQDDVKPVIKEAKFDINKPRPKENIWQTINEIGTKSEFKCSKCSFVTSYKMSLENHAQVHRINKEFKCEKCSKTFPEGLSLKLHVQAAHDNKANTCKFAGCDYKSENKRNLAHHEANGHKDENNNNISKGSVPSGRKISSDTDDARKRSTIEENKKRILEDTRKRLEQRRRMEEEEKRRRPGRMITLE